MARPKMPRDEAGNIVRPDAPKGNDDGRSDTDAVTDAASVAPADAMAGGTASAVADPDTIALEAWHAGGLTPLRLLALLPDAAMLARHAQPFGSEAVLNAVLARLYEIRTMIPAAVEASQGQTRDSLIALANLL